MGVVGDKSDLEGWPRWDNWPWGDVAAVPPQNIGRLWSSIADLYEVVSEKNKRNELDCSQAFLKKILGCSILMHQEGIKKGKEIKGEM